MRFVNDIDERNNEPNLLLTIYVIINSMGLHYVRSFANNRGVVPLRHLRHVPPDSVATLANTVYIVYRTELTVSLCA